MDKNIDTGDILIQEKIPIETDETGFELYNKCMNIGSKLLIKYETIEDIPIINVFFSREGKQVWAQTNPNFNIVEGMLLNCTLD